MKKIIEVTSKDNKKLYIPSNYIALWAEADVGGTNILLDIPSQGDNLVNVQETADQIKKLLETT